MYSSLSWHRYADASHPAAARPRRCHRAGDPLLVEASWCVCGPNNSRNYFSMHVLCPPPGDVSAWKVEYALVALYFGCAGYVLGMSEDWSRLVHNRQAAMRAMSSMRAWRRFKQASFLAGAFRSPTAAAHADVSTPDEFDARMCPLWPWIPGVSPVSSPASQRRAFWSCALISSCAFPALAYGLMKTQILPGGALGVGIVVLISAPPINWTLLGPYGNAHNGPQ